MRPTLQSRLQGSFKHGKHRRSHSMIMHVCEFDFLSLPARIMKPCVSDARARDIMASCQLQGF